MGSTFDDNSCSRHYANGDALQECLVFQHSPDAIVLHAVDVLEVRALNPAARRWFGEDVVPGPIAADSPLGSVLSAVAAIEVVAIDAARTFEVEDARHVKRFLECRTVPVRFADEDTWLSTFRDVTDRVQAQEREELARRSMLDTVQRKSEYVAAISHELRTPMNGILGMSALLLESRLSREQQEYAETIHSAADTLIRLLNEILDLAKMEAGRLQVNPAPFSLPKVCEDAVRLLRPRAAEQGIALEIETRGEIPAHSRGDALRLQQILINLLGNAVKFTHQGSVVLRLLRMPAEGDSARVRVEVQDTGIGIEASALHRIFEPFSQANGSSGSAYGGTGLGLAISHRLVELMGSELQAQSEVGVGTTFWFELELEDLDRTTTDADLASDDSEILYVGAAGPTREHYVDALQDRGYHVETCDLSAVALDRIRTRTSNGRPFVAVLIEQQLPDLDGETVGRSVRNRLRVRELPLFLVNSAGRTVDAARARRSGFGHVLTDANDLAQLDRIVDPEAATPPPSDAGGGAAHAAASEATAPRSPAATVTTDLGDGAHGAAPVVLVVEDNPVNQKVVCHMLRKMGFEVVLAEDGQQGVERVREGAYDLVLMDCQMPVMDGYEATRTIRGLEGGRARVPVIALTANAMEGDREKCLAAGMDDYLSKPAKAEQLREMLGKWIPDCVERLDATVAS